jgi:muramidase (phage lysozyme)
MTSAELEKFLSNVNVIAFLRLIRQGESNQTDGAYTLINGGAHFSSFADHPYKGQKSPPGRASGAYQFLATTWAGLVKLYGFTDFSPRNQDIAAVALIAGRKALDDVLYGRIPEAMAKCRQEWTSLPSAAEQNQSFTGAIDVYHKWGGRDATNTTVTVTLPPTPTEQIKDALRDSIPPEDLQTVAEYLATKGRTMPIAALISAFGPALVELIPQIAKLFSSGSEVATRNVAAAEAVFNTVVKASGQANIQSAVEAMQADPALTSKVTQEVVTDPMIIGLLEVGGGIVKAREAMSDPGQIPYDKNPAYRMSLFLLPLLYIVVVAVVSNWGGGWSDEMRSVVVTAIVTGLLGSLTGFFLGSSLGSQRKTEMNGAIK